MARLSKFDCQLSDNDQDEMYINIQIVCSVGWFLKLAKQIMDVTCKVVAPEVNTIEHKEE